MKIKNIIYIIVVLMLAGCEGFLDLKPQQSISSETALNSSENIRLALNQAYVNVRNAYGQQLFHCSELLADDGEIYFQGTFLEPAEMINKDLVASSVWPQAAWQDLYKGIYICNQVLMHIDVVDEADQNQIVGEARFLRGMCYFDLARFYAPTYQPGGSNAADAVPLLLGNEEDMYPTRSSVEEIYTQAQNDLEAAVQLLSEDEAFFAGKYGAEAVLSRLYLMKEMWAEAANVANDVIESNLFELSATPLAAFNHDANMAEDVFMFQQNNDDNLGSLTGTGNEGLSTFYASTNVTGRSDFVITDVVFDLYEPGDLRGAVQLNLDDDSDESDIDSMYYNGFGNDAGGGIFCAKWLNFERNVTFVRLAEMYLTRAEANLENGSEIGDTPVNDIKMIRTRAGVTTPETVDIDFVKKERIRELIFEGQRLHDYKRWGWPIGDLSADAPQLVLPIPQREREVNTNLTQNENY